MYKGAARLHMVIIVILLIIFSGNAGCSDKKSDLDPYIEDQIDIRNSENNQESEYGNSNYSQIDAIQVRDDLISVISKELLLIDTSMTAHSIRISQSTPNKNEKKKILAETRNISPHIQSPIILDKNLIITEVAYDEYEDLVGSDLSDQDHLNEVVRTGEPVMGTLIQTVEGIPAIPVSYPILVNNTVFGVLSILVDQKTLFADAILVADRDNRCNVYVLQPDGQILYDNEPDKTEKNTIGNSGSMENSIIKKTIGQIETENSGDETVVIQSEDYPESNNRTHDIVWDTIAFHGKKWKIIVIKPLNNISNQ